MGASAGAADARAVRRVQLLPGLTAVVLTVLLLWLAGTVAEVLLFFFLAILVAIYLDALAAILAARTKLGRGPSFALRDPHHGRRGRRNGRAPRAARRRANASAHCETSGLRRRLEGAARAPAGEFPALQPLLTPENQAQFVSGALDQAQGFVGGLLPKVFNIARGFIDVASILVMALYLALRPATYRDFAISITPPRHRDATRAVLDAVGNTLRSWVMAQLLTMAVLGALTAVGLKLLNVPYWLTFGLFSGLAAIVPFFGTLISTVVPALFVLGGTGGPVGAMLVLLLGVGVHLIEANVVAPIIMQRGVHLPPVFSIMAVLIAGTVLGPLGLLVAVPSLCIVMVLVRKVLIERVYGDVATIEEKREDAELALTPSSSAQGSES